MNAKQKFWEIRAAKDDPKVGEVLLYGYISNTSWWGDEVTPKEFAKDLKALGDVDEIRVYINSGGGDVFAAQAIYSMLKREKATVNVWIDGLAASAASFVAMAGETVTIPKNGLIMVHNPWTLAFGNSTEFRKIADDLDKIRTAMIEVYAAKTGLTDEEIIALLDAETWLTADEAKEKGFADVVEELKEVAASINGNTLTVNGRQVDLTPFRSFPKDRFPQEVSASQEATEAASDSQRQARLRVLRLRART